MEAVKELKSLAVEYLRMKYPIVPEFAIPKPKYNVKTTNGLTKAIIDYLRFKGCQAERISSMGRVIDSRKVVTDVVGRKRTIGSMIYIPTTGQKGTADISATIKGRSVKIEVKYGKDKLSKCQKEYQKQIEASGGIYYVARTFELFHKWFHNLNFRNHET